MKENIVLPKIEIARELKKLPGWKYQNGKLAKEFNFKDFAASVDFINKLLPFFEKINHHPDLHIFYNRILFELQKHEISDVVKEDFGVAKEIERLYKLTDY